MHPKAHFNRIRKLEFLTLAAELTCSSVKCSIQVLNPTHLKNILDIVRCIAERLLLFESAFLCYNGFIQYYKNIIKNK